MREESNILGISFSVSEKSIAVSETYFGARTVRFDMWNVSAAVQCSVLHMRASAFDVWHREARRPSLEQQVLV